MGAIIEAFIVQLVADCVSKSLVLILQDLPSIMAAVRTANTTTLTDAPPPPVGITAGVYQEIDNVGK